MGSSQPAQPENRKAEEDKMQQPDATTQTNDDDEPDEWDKRIFSTGCSEENAKMTDCYFEKKDWRACTSEGQRQLRCQSRLGTRHFDVRFSSTSTSSAPAASPPPSSSSSSSSKSEPDAAPVAAKPKYAPLPRPATKPFFKPYSTSSSTTTSKASPSSAATAAIPGDLFYQPATIAHAENDSGVAGATTDIPVVDWSASFHGIASRPVTARQFAALMKPLDVDDIEVKPDGIIYLPEIRYRRRLNEAFGPMGWGLIPKGDAVVGNSVVTREYALIVDGRFVSQAQGENSYFGADQLPSAVEGCKSNALMRCCKDLGIASELWDPSFIRWFKKNRMEEVWVEHATTKKKRTLWYRKGAVDVAYPYRQTK
ncbi:hypothetical protein MY3296_000772 [Beauveria thailandica]